MGLQEVYDRFVRYAFLPDTNICAWLCCYNVHVCVITHADPNTSCRKEATRDAPHLLRKDWSREVTVILIGVLMAAAFYFSLTGRNGESQFQTRYYRGST